MMIKAQHHHHEHSASCNHDHDHHHEEEVIYLFGDQDFEGMRKAGRLASQTLDFITPHVKAGVTTSELDKLCHDYILAHGAVPAPLGYRG